MFQIAFNDDVIIIMIKLQQFRFNLKREKKMKCNRFIIALAIAFYVPFLSIQRGHLVFLIH